MLRRSLLLLAATLAAADPRQELIDVFGAMASALSEGNPAVFLRAIDPAMPGYQRFAGALKALATQNALSCAIEISKQEGDSRVQTVELDWLLEIVGKDDSHTFVRRQAAVKCRLERQKNKWRIVSLEPSSFFAPPGADSDK
jgi:murein L,D-transpeptidase YcbB/YkuD